MVSFVVIFDIEKSCYLDNRYELLFRYMLMNVIVEEYIEYDIFGKSVLLREFEIRIS